MMRSLILFIHLSLPGYQTMPDPGRFGMYLRSMVFIGCTNTSGIPGAGGASRI